ncbi:MAG: ATP-binding protein [Oscillospiraceae bacterium]|nr:ATP-binding protein [Oscillospiraceae bacterium]
MLYSKDAVRDNIRNRDGKRVFYLGKGDQLTSDARDYLTRERIEIFPASDAKPERYRLLNGGYMDSKPENMTHLNGFVLVPKTHPRILLRGAVDTLEAELLLCCAAATGHIRKQLEEALGYARNLLRYEVMGEPVKEALLGGMDEKMLRERSHRPQEFYGQPHFMPGPEDSALLLQVNKARCAARAAELHAVAAFPDSREDLLRGFNRLSSFLYLIMIQIKVDCKE